MTRLAPVAALFVDPAGSYSGLPDVDLWPEARDARLYAGPYPVVAHPPCSRWCQFAPVNQARWGAMIGDDGGCFVAALNAVRAYGGVLEHPAYTLAWPRYNLPRPTRGVWTRSLLDDGWVTELSQSAYGHPARKRTWLYAVACELPVLHWKDLDGKALIGGRGTKGLPEGRYRIQDAPAAATPVAFRDVLLAMARSASRQASAVA